MWTTGKRSCVAVIETQLCGCNCVTLLRPPVLYKAVFTESYSPLKIHLASFLACGLIPPRYTASNVVVRRLATVTIPFPLLPTRQPKKIPNGSWTLKSIHTREVHMPDEVTDRPGARQEGSPLPLWFKLLLSSLICLLLLLPIYSSWHPPGTAHSCHYICCPPPEACKSLWHDSIRKIMVFLCTAIYSFMLWTC